MKKKLNAFTLTELLIGILVIAVLTVASMSIVAGHVKKATLTKEQINELYGCDWQVVCANDKEIQDKTGAKPCSEYKYPFDLDHKYWIITKDSSNNKEVGQLITMTTTNGIFSRIDNAKSDFSVWFDVAYPNCGGQDTVSANCIGAQPIFLLRQKSADGKEIVAIYQHDLFCNFNRLPIDTIEINVCKDLKPCNNGQCDDGFTCNENGCCIKENKATTKCEGLTPCNDGKCDDGFTCNEDGCCEKKTNACGDLTPCDNGQCDNGFTCNEDGCCIEEDKAITKCEGLTPCNDGKCDDGFTCNEDGCCEETQTQCSTKRCSSKADCDHGQKCNANGCCEQCVTCEKEYVDCAVILIDNGGSTRDNIPDIQKAVKNYVQGRDDLYLGLDFYQSSDRFAASSESKYASYVKTCPKAIKVAKNNAGNIISSLNNTWCATGSNFDFVKKFWEGWYSYKRELFVPADGTTCKRQHLIVISDNGSIGNSGTLDWHSTKYTAQNGYTVDFISVDAVSGSIYESNAKWIKNIMGGQIYTLPGNYTLDKLIQQSLGGTCKNTCDD